MLVHIIIIPVGDIAFVLYGFTYAFPCLHDELLWFSSANEKYVIINYVIGTKLVTLDAKIFLLYGPYWNVVTALSFV
jgi:hypothetical protein